jgi:hypothetical protein
VQTTIAPPSMNRALGTALATPPAKMQWVVLAPPLCHVPGPDPERAAVRRFEIQFLIPEPELRALDPDQDHGSAM